MLGVMFEKKGPFAVLLSLVLAPLRALLAPCKASFPLPSGAPPRRVDR